MNFTIGFTRVNGTVKIDTTAPANSTFDFRMYPAGSMAPDIDEEGKVRIEWFANHANSTLVCFHSTGASQTSDGRPSLGIHESDPRGFPAIVESRNCHLLAARRSRQELRN